METQIRPNTDRSHVDDLARIGTVKWKNPLKIGTWNVLSLYRAGYAKTLIEEINKYDIDIMAVQETRWTGEGECKMGNYTILYSGRKDGIHREGVGFCISNKVYRAVESFNPVNERIAHIRINCQWFKLSMIVTYAPTEESEEDQKDEFYEILQTVIEKIPKHDVIIVTGDMNAKVGREVDVFGPAIGVHSAHEECNDNGTRLASFANANRMVIGGTLFPHKSIHKQTWNSPDGNTKNQIDHILISRRFRSALIDVRSYRGADCDTDHNMVGAKVEIISRWRRILEMKEEHFLTHIN